MSDEIVAHPAPKRERAERDRHREIFRQLWRWRSRGDGVTGDGRLIGSGHGTAMTRQKCQPVAGPRLGTLGRNWDDQWEDWCAWQGVACVHSFRSAPAHQLGDPAVQVARPGPGCLRPQSPARTPRVCAPRSRLARPPTGAAAGAQPQPGGPRSPPPQAEEEGRRRRRRPGLVQGPAKERRDDRVEDRIWARENGGGRQRCLLQASGRKVATGDAGGQAGGRAATGDAQHDRAAVQEHATPSGGRWHISSSSPAQCALRLAAP